MKAMVYTGPLELQMLDIEDPKPVDGDVVVEVKAAGICGSELEGFASQSPFRVPPLVMGHEFAGVRADTGARVAVNPLIACDQCAHCRAGQPNRCTERQIIGIHRPGSFAERIAVPAANCVPVPDTMPFERAALIEPIANAVHAVGLARASMGSLHRVGVIGAGMIGLAVVLVAADAGAASIAVADLADARLRIAEGAGAHRVGSQLDGEFDVIFDAVGSGATRAASVQLVRRGGLTVWLGLHGDDAGFDGLDLVRGEKTVAGSFCYHRDEYEAAVRLADRVDAAWVTTRPLASGVEAFLGLLNGPAAAVKTVLVP